MSGLAGSVALVTGAASGIGEAVALRIAEEGGAVGCLDICDAHSTVDQICSLGGTARSWQMDVSSPVQWVEAVSAAIAEWGAVHLLANVAGVTPGATPDGKDTVLNLSEELWDHVIQTNLKGVWLGMKNVIPHMIRAGGGKIVNTTSVAAIRGMPGMAAYASSKGGIISLTQQAAAEYARDHVFVNAVAPGMIFTPVKREDPEMFQAKAEEFQLIPRLGEPSEVASMIAYLFREGSFLTGQTFRVDGGWTIRG